MFLKFKVDRTDIHHTFTEGSVIPVLYTFENEDGDEVYDMDVESKYRVAVGSWEDDDFDILSDEEAESQV
jgi:hypothetical protein